MKQILAITSLLIWLIFPTTLIMDYSLHPGSAASQSEHRALFWQPECVDCPRDILMVGDRSISIDSNGNPHVVFAGDKLVYAWMDAGVWHQDIIDDAPGGDADYQTFPSLALDQAGNPHISYTDRHNTSIRYASKHGSTWLIQTISSNPSKNYGFDTAIAIDPAGNPRIAYSVDGHLRQAVFNGISWSTESVDGGYWFGWHFSLAIDNLGISHISYYDDVLGILKYAVRLSTHWKIEIVDDSAWLGEFNSIAINPQNQPEISYLDYENGMLKHAIRSDGSWKTESITTARWYGGFTSLAFDASGYACISYSDPELGLRIARFNGSGWENIPLENRGVWFTSLAVYDQDLIKIVFFDTIKHNLYYGELTQGSWQTSLVSTISDVGRHLVFDIDSHNRPSFIYFDKTGKRLKYASKDPDQGWKTEALEFCMPCDSSADIKLDSSDNAVITFRDELTGDLKLAKQTTDGWEVSKIVDNGRFPSLALDSYDQPHISFLAHDTGALRYAVFTGSEWITKTVDTYSSGQSSIALSENGSPQISYSGVGEAGVFYAYLDGGHWITQTIDNNGRLAGRHSMVVDQNMVRIVYVSPGSNQLKLATKNNSEWSLETLTDIAPNTQASVLSNDLGELSILYFSSNSGLAVLSQIQNGWISETVPGSTRSYQWADFAFDRSGGVRIGFYDGFSFDLIYLVGLPSRAYLPLIEK